MNKHVGRMDGGLHLSRRSFLATTLITAALPAVARATKPIGRTRPSHFKLSLAAYSYRNCLTGPQKRMDLFGFADLAARLALDAIEPTAYYFPEKVTDDYLHRLSQYAFRLGLDISGTAIGNDFCLPPGAERDEQLAQARRWIDHAAELDAPTVRVLSGNWIQGTSDEELEQRVIQALEELLPHAEKRGVMLALENHGGGATVTSEQLLRILRRVDDPNLGVNLDTWNFHSEDPYREIAEVAPYAVNVQIKTEIRRMGQTKEPADLARTIDILRKAKYSGYVVLEYNAAEEPKTAVPRYIKILRSLIA
jgi:sugar phosphate isomerase/epimerase